MFGYITKTHTLTRAQKSIKVRALPLPYKHGTYGKLSHEPGRWRRQEFLTPILAASFAVHTSAYNIRVVPFVSAVRYRHTGPPAPEFALRTLVSDEPTTILWLLTECASFKNTDWLLQEHSASENNFVVIGSLFSYDFRTVCRLKGLIVWQTRYLHYGARSLALIGKCS